MTTHELKIWPEYFVHILSGEKAFELRIDDRGYRAGDHLLLKEWLPRNKDYTGREILKRVTYLMGGQWPGLVNGYVLMSIGDPSP